MATFTNDTKNTSSYTNETKHSSVFSTINRSDLRTIGSLTFDEAGTFALDDTLPNDTIALKDHTFDDTIIGTVWTNATKN